MYSTYIDNHSIQFMQKIEKQYHFLKIKIIGFL